MQAPGFPIKKEHIAQLGEMRQICPGTIICQVDSFHLIWKVTRLLSKLRKNKATIEPLRQLKFIELFTETGIMLFETAALAADTSQSSHLELTLVPSPSNKEWLKPEEIL